MSVEHLIKADDKGQRFESTCSSPSHVMVAGFARSLQLEACAFMSFREITHGLYCHKTLWERLDLQVTQPYSAQMEGKGNYRP